MEITAAVLRTTDGPYRLETVELAPPGPDEVLVRVVAAGMCHTDVVPRQLDGFLPIITGHEGSGVVEEVGAEVQGISVGDHVVLSFDSCGRCASCTGGLPSYCDTFMVRNLSGRDVAGQTRVTDADGGEIASRWFGQSSFATHCLATSRNVVVVDEDLPLEAMGPLGCGLLTGAGTVLRSLDVQPGEGLVVFGAGAVGLAAVMAAAVVGADPIVAVDLHQHRLDLARELGATHVVAGDAPGLVEDLSGITGGGATYAVDTTGVPAVMQSALAAVRMGGQVGFVGVQTGDLTLDPVALVGKRVAGILEGDADPHELIPHLIGLWREGRFPFDRLVKTFPLAGINAAEAASLSGEVVKPVLRP